jgi:hypothetical protein
MRAVDPRTGRLYRVVGPAQHFESPPKALQRARLDNLAIVPASLLTEKAEWQALANTLPAGSTLIILPSKPSAARAALEQVSRSLLAHGSRVTTVEQNAGRLRGYWRETITP